MQRCRSYIEVAFQCNPHRADDRILLKREKACRGETASLKRILEKYIENSPLRHFFFSLSETISYLSFRVESMLIGERARGREGYRVFFYVGLKCKGCN